MGELVRPGFQDPVMALACLALLPLLPQADVTKRFQVIWNSPTQTCSAPHCSPSEQLNKKTVSEFGITANDKMEFIGSEIALLCEPSAPHP